MMEYAVAYRAHTGAVIALTEPTVLREFAYHHLAECRANEEIDGGDPTTLFVARRTIPAWTVDESEADKPEEGIERPTAPPTDDEREALWRLIHRLMVLGKVSTPQEVTDAILAAGFRRQGPITDAQVEAAAHALFDASQELGQENDWSDPLPDEWREAWRDAARAALEAARED